MIQRVCKRLLGINCRLPVIGPTWRGGGLNPVLIAHHLENNRTDISPFKHEGALMAHPYVTLTGWAALAVIAGLAWAWAVAP